MRFKKFKKNYIADKGGVPLFVEDIIAFAKAAYYAGNDSGYEDGFEDGYQLALEACDGDCECAGNHAITS